MDLIDRQELARRLATQAPEQYSGLVAHIISTAPTIEAERHGRWIYTPKDAIEAMFSLPKCSVCGHESSDALNYCPNCGAKMDLDEAKEG